MLLEEYEPKIVVKGFRSVIGVHLLQRSAKELLFLLERISVQWAIVFEMQKLWVVQFHPPFLEK